MATSAATVAQSTPASGALAARHLMTHFGAVGAAGLPIYVRGEGCYVWDDSGKRYLDGLSMLFCVNAGHGRAELAEAAAAQARELAFATTWDAVHPCAIELAARIAQLAPGDLNRVFFTSGGSESVETALKFVRAYHGLRGEPRRVKVIARELAYHGTTMGALSATGLPSVRTPFEPLAPGGCHVPHTTSTGAARRRSAVGGRRDRAADPVRGAGDGRRGDPRARPELRRLPRAPGRLLRARARDLRPPRGRDDLRRHDLLVGPPGHLVRRAALRLRAGRHHDGEGPDVGLRADGGDDRVGPARGALSGGRAVVRPRAHLRRAPVAAAVALANLDVLEGEDLLGTSAVTSPRYARSSRACATSRSSATSAGRASSGASSWSRTRPPSGPSSRARQRHWSGSSVPSCIAAA
jgi:hypothetical protein